MEPAAAAAADGRAASRRLNRLQRQLCPQPSSAPPSAQASPPVSFPTVKEYLARIGLGEVYPPPARPPPTEETLRTLHAAHQLTVPFENLGKCLRGIAVSLAGSCGCG